MNDPTKAFEPRYCRVHPRDVGQLKLKLDFNECEVVSPLPPGETFPAVLIPRDLYERLVGEDWQPIETAPTCKWVLVSGPIDDGEPWVTLAVKLDCGEWSDSEHDAIPEPTHWRPLPEGPR